ncbi:MAG: HlyD family efflux transporter periplasmic adaptor subunit [Lachnospiraceae bacterium]|nr:HlyD family efflux transporter periplasmic adaptor subunit [Lachnospiraceae bacterium]
MKKIGKVIIGAGIAAALAGGGFWYLNRPEEMDTAAVKRMTVTAKVSEVGHITADECVTIYASSAGRVSEVTAQVNDLVQADDTLLRYDVTSLETAYQMAVWNTAYHTDGYQAAVAENDKYAGRADAAAGAAQNYRQQYITAAQKMDELSIGQELENYFIQSDLNTLNAVLENLNLELSIHTANLEAAQSQYTELQNQTVMAEAEFNELCKKVDRTSDEEEKETIAAERDAKKIEWSTLQTARDVAAGKKAECERAVNELKAQIQEYRRCIAAVPLPAMTTEESLQYSSLALEREMVLHDWEQSLSRKAGAEEHISDPAALSQLEDAMELAKLQEEEAKKALERGKAGVPAGVSGIVMERLVDEGAYVEAGTPLFVIQPSGGYKAELLVSRFDIGSVAIGQKAEVTIGNTVYEGTVQRIAAVATMDASGKPKVSVEVALTDPDAVPVIGLEAEVCIYVSEAPDVLCIPERAVYTDDEGSYVYVIQNGVIAKQSIVKGLSGNGYVQITEGPGEGGQVIISPCSAEDIGTKVTTKTQGE